MVTGRPGRNAALSRIAQQEYLEGLRWIQEALAPVDAASVVRTILVVPVDASLRVGSIDVELCIGNPE